MLGRCVALTAAICIVGGLVTLLAALLLSLAPSSSGSGVRPILLAAWAMCAVGLVSYLVLAGLASFRRGRGLPVAPRMPIAASDGHTVASSGAASGANEPDDDGMPRWDRLNPPERTNVL